VHLVGFFIHCCYFDIFLLPLRELDPVVWSTSELVIVVYNISSARRVGQLHKEQYYRRWPWDFCTGASYSVRSQDGVCARRQATSQLIENSWHLTERKVSVLCPQDFAIGLCPEPK
jgi:hypothetical protein